MICLVSNIIIYSTQKKQEVLRQWLTRQDLAISIISKIEILGYHHISDFEIEMVEYYFSLYHLFKPSDRIANRAIQLRQSKKMGLGVAIIAATALENQLTLATANNKDFEHLKDLSLVNPIE